jgi:hypothetical protein
LKRVLGGELVFENLAAQPLEPRLLALDQLHESVWISLLGLGKEFGLVRCVHNLPRWALRFFVPESRPI